MKVRQGWRRRRERGDSQLVCQSRLAVSRRPLRSAEPRRWPPPCRRIRPRRGAPGRMRGPAVPDPARRHLAVSRQSDRPEGTRVPVRQRAEARGRRLFWLETPAERGRIEVEDAPFVAVELDWTGDGRQQTLSFRTNVDQVVTAGPDHPIRVAHDLLTCEPTPYILVRAGAGNAASRRASTAPSITSWSRSPCPNGSAAAACWRLEPRPVLLAGRTAPRRGVIPAPMHDGRVGASCARG